jgi:hypothetical protein
MHPCVDLVFEPADEAAFSYLDALWKSFGLFPSPNCRVREAGTGFNFPFPEYVAWH